MQAIDSVYEYAGYDAAAELHDLLVRLGIPLLIALGGVAWRFLRTAEEGLPRPLAIHLFSLIAIWWLLTPRPIATDGRANVRAPRFTAWLSEATDRVTTGAIRAIDERFLSSPFEWERLAAMCGLARAYDPATRENLHAFFEGCTRPALAALDGPPNPQAEGNPLHPDADLPYDRFSLRWQAGPQRGQEVGCRAARDRLIEDVRREIRSERFHREAIAALKRYDPASPAALEELYVDQVIRNEWTGPLHEDDEMAAVRASVGRYELMDVRQNPYRTRGNPLFPGRAADVVHHLSEAEANYKTSVTALIPQFMSEAFDAKQRYYLVTTMAPDLYGLSVLLLLALFPIAGLWALLPGKWTALANYGKLFLSVKLWPVGWAVLSSFNARRPAVEAFHRPGEPPAGTENLFLAVVLMYFVVPAVSFALVQVVSCAASFPLRPAGPPPAGAGALRAVAPLATRR